VRIRQSKVNRPNVAGEHLTSVTSPRLQSWVVDGGERIRPEELAEARHYATCYQAGYVHDLMHNFLAHIDQQAARIAELDDAVSGPLENITKMLETVNADMIFSGIIQTWKNENGTLKTRITELESTIDVLKEEF
jgi:hypothetical protein